MMTTNWLCSEAQPGGQACGTSTSRRDWCCHPDGGCRLPWPFGSDFTPERTSSAITAQL